MTLSEPRPFTKKLLYFSAGLFILSFLIRLYALETLSPFTGDESMHIASASNFAERGYFGPDNWYHPPLKHVLLYGSIKLFGDNPYGWRMRNVLFGAGTVVATFLLGFRISGSLRAALISSLLLLFDPLHVIFSRTTFEDIPAVFFLVAGVLSAIRAYETGRERDWLAAGILMGFSTALRLYGAIALLVIFLFAAKDAFARDGFSGIVRMVSYLLVLPFSIYLAVYYPWFHRGYSLGEWLSMQADALREMRFVNDFQPILNELRGPGRWFAGIVAVGFNLEQDDGFGRYIVIMNNLPVWIFIIPSILYMHGVGIQRKIRAFTFLAISFWALYLPVLAASRPIFLYTSLCLLPFSFIAIGLAADRLVKDYAYHFLTIASAWSICLYPLVVGIPVPFRIYQPILSFISIHRPS